MWVLKSGQESVHFLKTWDYKCADILCTDHASSPDALVHQRLKSQAGSKELQAEFQAAKKINKARLAARIEHACGVKVIHDQSPLSVPAYVLR